jgi:hypothetical protein
MTTLHLLPSSGHQTAATLKQNALNSAEGGGINPRLSSWKSAQADWWGSPQDARTDLTCLIRAMMNQNARVGAGYNSLRL